MGLAKIEFGRYQGEASVHTRAARLFGEALGALGILGALAVLNICPF